MEKQRYTLPPENIILLGEGSDIRKRGKEWFEGLQEESITWPIEIQGSGTSDYETKEFRVCYPEGDIFLSSAITIHELGHLRQGEINERFAEKCLGSPEPQPNSASHYKTEQDAWHRGLWRTQKYWPQYLDWLEERFCHFKQQGQFSSFGNFQEFYQYATEVGLKMTEFFDSLPETDDVEKGRLLGKLIRSEEITNEFFTHQEVWRSGETVDKGRIENFIQRIAQETANEKL